MYCFTMETKSENTFKNDGSQANQKPIIRCPICGATIWKNNLRRHNDTKKHNDAKYIMLDKFEIK